MPNAARMLASDLDGTLIPPDSAPAAAKDPSAFVDAVASRALMLAYVTGRHLSLAVDGIALARLPMPDWLVCDVGTSVFARHGAELVADVRYRQVMQAALGAMTMAGVEVALSRVPGLELQEAAKQAEFKRSYFFRFDRAAEVIAAARRCLQASELRVQLVDSRDPVSGAGLLDVLPTGTGKRHALTYLTRAGEYSVDAAAYAGDSGNDLDALLSGHPAIVVGNAPQALKLEIEQSARDQGISDRVYLAESSYAQGVLEGCRHFGFL